MEADISIVGYGYVGKAMARFFSRQYAVEVYDPAYVQGGLEKSSTAGVLYEVDNDDPYVSQFVSSATELTAPVAVICVPTEPKTEANQEFLACDVSLVEESVGNLKHAELIIIKSTVPPGTTERIIAETGKQCVFSPEYAGESAYWSPYMFDDDVAAMPYYIFGGEPVNTQRAIDIYTPIGGPTKRYVQMRAREAELVKYTENAFFATKVTFANELRSLCDAFDADFQMVRDGWILDPRVNPMHTMAFAEDRGFGGKCYPKDLQAIVHAATARGYTPTLLQEVWRANLRFRNSADSDGTVRSGDAAKRSVCQYCGKAIEGKHTRAKRTCFNCRQKRVRELARKRSRK